MCVVELSRRSSIDAGRKTGSILSRACLLSLPLSYAVMASKTFQEAVAVEPLRVPLLLLKFFCFYLSGQQHGGCENAASSQYGSPTARGARSGWEQRRKPVRNRSVPDAHTVQEAAWHRSL